MFARRVIQNLSIALAVWLLGHEPVHAELVAYWDFDTDFAADVGGPTYDATPFNGASISAVEAKWGGGAAQFDDALMQYATTGASPFGVGSYSYSLWFYLDVEFVGEAPFHQYAGFGTGGPDDAYTAFFNIAGDAAADPGTADDLLVARVRHDGPDIPPNVVALFPDLPTDHQQWKNLVVTVRYDDVANTTQIQMFYNGSSVGASDALSGQPIPSTYVAFGVDRDLVGRFWKGWIDDVAVYDHVLTLAEIAALQLSAASDVGSGSPGDYNGDGFVDAADYTFWRDTLGQNSTLQHRNPSITDPLVNQADYAFWKANFGGGGGGAGGSTSVPEPTTLCSAFFAICLGLIPWRVRNGA